MAADRGAAEAALEPGFPPRRVAGRARGWFRGDCHTHSARSHGGELAPEQLAAAAREAGLDFIAVTEHNTADTHAAWGPPAGDDLLVILGQEVVTAAGHWLAVGVEPGQVVDGRYRIRDDVVDGVVAEVHAVGGLCIAAHPHAPYPSGVFRHPFRRFDAVEVWNGPWRPDRAWNADNEAALADWGSGLAADIQQGPWRPAVGNSDVHLAGQLGTPQTVVLAEELSTDAVLAGIRAGRCWIAESAEVGLSFTVRADDRCAGVGERLATRGEQAVARVAVEGVPNGAVGFHTDRGPAHHELLPGDGTGIAEWRTSADASAFVRIEVRHPAGHVAALTNPIILT